MVILAVVLLAAAATAFCLHRTETALKGARQMVSDAAAQLHRIQQQTEKKHNSHKSAEMLSRSRRIYAQATALYEQTLSLQKYHPWATLLGYGPIGENGLPIYRAPLWRRENRPAEKKGATAMKTNNMKRAVFEMFGVGHGEPTEVLIVEAQNSSDETALARPTEVSSPAKAEPTVSAAAPVVSLKPVSYLAADTVWEGNLRSEGDVEVAGVFRGDISAKGSVILRSTVEGNVQAGSLQLSGCTLAGDTTAAELVVVAADSCVTGNIAARDLRCAGTINGDITVSGHITLEQTARVCGNITTDSISVAKGATICGGVEIKSCKA